MVLTDAPARALPRHEDLQRARELLRGRVLRTPLLRSRALDAIAGAELFLKAESLQKVGAFKARGALVAALSLDEADRRRGLVTFSSGNHGQAVALAALELGVQADIVMPTDAPKVKVDAVRALGARVHFAGTTSDERKRLALELAQERGAVVVPPFDDARVIAGQGTATLELLEQAAEEGAELDAVVVPVGGGGLLAGACLACEGTATLVYAVEPSAASAFAESLAAGERVLVQPGATIADGLKPVQIGALNFEVARTRVAGALLVDDAEIGQALVDLLFAAKLLVEPSGAAALAAALEHKLPGSPQRIGVLLSGGNVAPDRLAGLLERHAPRF
jgi:threo-3-hydroxy-L-aspartate ammonia-lyase